MTEANTDYVEETDIVTYEAADGIAWIAMNRPKYNNAQNGRMTYELDAAFMRAVADDDVKVIVLKGEGKHFSAGHDIGTPGRDVHLSQERVTSWYDHANKPGGEYSMFARQRLTSVCAVAGGIFQNRRLLRFRAPVLPAV